MTATFFALIRWRRRAKPGAASWISDVWGGFQSLAEILDTAHSTSSIRSKFPPTCKCASIERVIESRAIPRARTYFHPFPNGCPAKENLGSFSSDPDSAAAPAVSGTRCDQELMSHSRRAFIKAAAATVGTAPLALAATPMIGEEMTPEEVICLFDHLPGEKGIKIFAPAANGKAEFLAQWNASTRMFVASAIKTFVLCEALRQAD
jgi:hypothetical protein